MEAYETTMMKKNSWFDKQLSEEVCDLLQIHMFCAKGSYKLSSTWFWTLQMQVLLKQHTTHTDLTFMHISNNYNNV